VSTSNVKILSAKTKPTSTNPFESSDSKEKDTKK